MAGSLLGRVRYGAVPAIRKLAVMAGLAVGLMAAPVGVGPASAETTIAALGDSLTQGYGLPRQEGFVPQLEAWLREKGAEVTIVNAGVSGDTTAGGLSRVEWTLTEDVDALIVALGGNDMLRGLDPADSRANLDAILDAADAKGVPALLIGLSAPGNYGPEYKAAFDAMYPDLAAEHGAAYAGNFLEGLTAMDDRREALARYMQQDGIHPNGDGVRVIVETLGPKILAFSEAVDAER